MTFKEWLKISNYGKLDVLSVTRLNCSITSLNYRDNKITSIEGIEVFKNLQVLDCVNNNIQSLNPLRYLKNLKTLNCNNNNISTLEPLKNLNNLKLLSCNDNNISSLEPLKNLNNLEALFCDNNKIKDLSWAPKNLYQLDYEGNPVYSIFENKFIDDIYQIVEKLSTKALSKINEN